MQSYSQSYIDGITEGRSYKRAFQPNHDDMAALLDNAKRCIRISSGPVKDMHKGERDFWANQLKGIKK